MKKLQFPVLRVNQPIGEFYIASLPAKDVLSICEKDVRRLSSEPRDVENYLGIQRPINPKRAREIREYVSQIDATFPTTVILAVDEKCAELIEHKGGMAELVLSEFVASDDYDQNIEFNRIARVLDGQHRMAGFTDSDDNTFFDFIQKFDGEFNLNVAFFIGADLSRQANIFARVNLAQTKVNKSLVYDLLELEKNRSPLKTCHIIAKALDGKKSSPFYERIKRLGIRTSGREHETITQASFVEALVKFISHKPQDDRNDILNGKELRQISGKELTKLPFRNLFIQNRDSDITLIVFNFFNAVKKRWPNAWDDVNKTGNILPRSNALLALMRYLHQDLYIKLVGVENIGQVPTIDDFLVDLKELDIDDVDFNSRTFKPGSSGQADFYKFLTREKTKEELIG